MLELRDARVSGTVAVTVMRDTYRDGSRRGLTLNQSSGLHHWRPRIHVSNQRGPERPSLLHPCHTAALLFTPFTAFADEKTSVF